MKTLMDPAIQNLPYGNIKNRLVLSGLAAIPAYEKAVPEA
jgi:hypothetical protein